MNSPYSSLWLLMFIPSLAAALASFFTGLRLQRLRAQERPGDRLEFGSRVSWKSSSTVDANAEISRLSKRTRILTLLAVSSTLLATYAPKLWEFLQA